MKDDTENTMVVEDTNTDTITDNVPIQQIDKQQIERDIELAELTRQEIALRIPWFFLTEYAYTVDEHDAIHPIKRFPDHPYLKTVTDMWAENKLLVIAKSRQLMITWLMAGLHLWLALHTGKLIFFQSKKEEDADAILKRAKVIYANLPRRLKWGTAHKDIIDMSQDPPIRDIYCHLEFPWLNSEIMAVPQGPAVLRSRTASAIFSDEMAFQEQAKEAFTASKPTIDGGGKFTGVSTPNGQEYFASILFDIPNRN